MKKRVRVILIIIGIAMFGAVITLYVLRTEPWLSAEAAFKKGDNNIRNDHFSRAFHFFKIASDKEPGNEKYAWRATQTAVAAGNANAAYSYARKAWKNGRKKRDVLHTLVQFSFFSDKKQKLEYALSLIGQMADSVDKDDLRAELFVGFGEIEKARLLWQQQFNRAPQSALAVKLARAYLSEGNDSLALTFLGSCRSYLALDEEAYGILARLYAKKGNLKAAEQCYNEGGKADGSSGKLHYEHAVFLLNTKNYDQAEFMLDSLVAKFPENKNFESIRISVFLAKGDPASALRECDKCTAAPGVVAPFRARALLGLNRFAEAESWYDTAVAYKKDISILLEFGNFLLYRAHKYEKARALFQAVNSTQPSEPVSNIGLATLALEAHDVTNAERHIAAVLTDKKPLPLAYLLLAQLNVLKGNPGAALENCKKVLAALPHFEKALYVQAQAYSMLGQADKADDILSAMLRRAVADRVKSAAIKRTLIPVKAQEKKYGDALAIIKDLDRGGVSVDLRRMRLEILALSGDFAKAQETLSSLNGLINKNEFIYYQSWLAEIGGDTATAASILESDLSSKNIVLRWAKLRFEMGKTDKVMEKLVEDSMSVADWSALALIAEKRGSFDLCARCYNHALRHEEENPALLNNYAWASLQTSEFNHEEVLKAIKKADALLPDRAEVLQTYAEALNKCDKAGECIKLLEGKPLLTKISSSLLYQLGIAYEKTGDARGALSSFRLALALSDSTPLPMGLSRKDLAARAAQLGKKTLQ
jgi:predicted Zn-dependent protease